MGSEPEVATMGSEAWMLLLSPIVSALIAACLVYYFGIRQLVVERRLAFKCRLLETLGKLESKWG